MSRRADRLFQIVQILRGRRLTTAGLLAERLGVSERTIYRDIRDLSLSGVPVEGEAGSGYRLLAGYSLPPLMLTTEESEALVAAIRLLQTWGGESLSQSLESAGKRCSRFYLKRVGVRPSNRGCLRRILAPRATAKRSLIWCIGRFPASGCWRCITAMKRERCRSAKCCRWGSFSGGRWLLVSWCELRDDYRCFRLDRCLDVAATGRLFSERADRSLSDFLRKVR
jgi:predicted DNA-binding transcriptional regulator YafY